MSREALLAEGEAIVAGLARRRPWLEDLRVVGVGLATVELDRAADQLRAAGCSGWEPAARDDLLGAAARRCRDDGVQLVLLEPDTEGRLAASLARFGEGVAAVYLDRKDPHVGGPARAPGPEALGRAAPGPLGAARMVLGGPSWGPHLVVLEPGASP